MFPKHVYVGYPSSQKLILHRNSFLMSRNTEKVRIQPKPAYQLHYMAQVVASIQRLNPFLLHIRLDEWNSERRVDQDYLYVNESTMLLRPCLLPMK